MEPQMELTLNIELPRQHRAVAVLRHAVATLCSEVGVADEDVHDLTLALAEACNNVVTHAQDDDSFTVRFTLSDMMAKVEVNNAITPADKSEFDATEAVDPMSESGRGLMIMRHLVDEARFTPSPDGGTLVHLARQVSPIPGSLLDGATIG
jgi:serine/threonine-protein kinase RsbW